LWLAVEGGFVYIAQSPLYLIKKGKQKFYAMDEKEKDDPMKVLGPYLKRGRKSMFFLSFNKYCLPL